jgi:hypothetical protein
MEIHEHHLLQHLPRFPTELWKLYQPRVVKQEQTGKGRQSLEKKPEVLFYTNTTPADSSNLGT